MAIFSSKLPPQSSVISDMRSYPVAIEFRIFFKKATEIKMKTNTSIVYRNEETTTVIYIIYNPLLFFFFFLLLHYLYKCLHEEESQEQLRYTFRGGYEILREPLRLRSAFTRLVQGQLEISNHLSFYMFFFLTTGPSFFFLLSSEIIPAFNFSEFRTFQTFLYLSTLGHYPERRVV